MQLTTLKLSKLRPPCLPTAVIARPHLLELLREASGRCCLLSLISAPMGYGKSTLLAQHVAHINSPWAWLRCDHGDNQPLNFLMHLHRTIGLRSSEASPTVLNADNLWSQIIEFLEQQPAGFTLILDDLDRLRSTGVIRYLDELLRNPPANLHIVAASEGLPTVALSHLRRDRRLQLLDSRHLALTSNEIEMLAATRGQNLGSDAVYLLRASSEGWVSSVLLGLSALNEQSDEPSAHVEYSHATVQRFHALITHFFNEEVLDPLPPELGQLLESLSVVNTFDVELAVCLSGRSDSAALIAQLLHRNVFIQQCDDECRQYRLHTQLRQTLYQQLRLRASDGLRQLHQKAAEKLLQRQSYSEAVYQLGRAQDFNALLAAIDHHCFELLRAGEVSAIVDLLADMPEQNIEDHFTLAVTEASTLIVTNDIERAAVCLYRLKRLLQGQTVPERRVERAQQTLAFLRSRMAFLGGNFNHGIALVDEALLRYPQTNAATAVLLYNRACCLLALGQLHRSRHDTEQALSELTALNFDGYTNLLHLQLGMIELAQGQTLKAEERFTNLVKQRVTGTTHGFYDLFQHLGKGILLLQRNQLGQAAKQFANAEIIALDFPHCAGLPWVLHYQALCFVAQGELTRARSCWDEARRLARHYRLFALYRLAGTFRVRLAVREEEQSFIFEWLEEWRWCNRHYTSNLMPEEWLAYAWVQRHFNQRAWAAKISSKLHLLAVTEDNHQLSVDLHLLDASLSLDAADQSAALHRLEAALQQAASYDFCQLLHLEGRDLGELFRQLISPPVRSQNNLDQPLPIREKLAELLQGLTTHGHTDQSLIAPLTRREQVVLRCMIAGQGNQQIADDLYISLSTVKTHINNLFRKLDVVDREGALEAVRKLNLFS